MVCGKIKLKAWCERNTIDIDESLTVDMLLFAFDSDSNATLLGYLRYAEHTVHLHWHRVKVKSSYLPAKGVAELII